MKYQSTLMFVSSFATCCALSLTAAAQAAQAEALDTLPLHVPAPGAKPTALSFASEPRAGVIEHNWPNRPMLVTGGLLLAGIYGASVIVDAGSDRDADHKLYYPVVGPWLDLKTRDCEVDDCRNETFNKALLIGSGALQGVGALLVVLGLVVPESTEKPWYLLSDQNLNVSPEVGTFGTGLTASGRF